MLPACCLSFAFSRSSSSSPGCANLRRLNPCGLWATWGFVWGLSRLSIKSKLLLAFPRPVTSHMFIVIVIEHGPRVACLLNSILILLNLICSNHAHLGGESWKFSPLREALKNFALNWHNWLKLDELFIMRDLSPTRQGKCVCVCMCMYECLCVCPCCACAFFH